MPIGLLAPLLGYLATLIPKAADEVAMSPIKQGVKRMYGENNNRNQQQGLMAAPPQQAPGLAGQMQQPMQSTDPGNALAAQITMNPPQQQPQGQVGIMGHQNTDEGHTHRHPTANSIGDALMMYGQMTSPNGNPGQAMQMIQRRREAQAQAQMQAAEVAREQANRREDITRETHQFDVNTGLKQDQLKQGADQFAASEEDKRLTREAQAKQAAADNALNTGKLDLERTNAANENQYRQGMLANAQAETKQKQQQAAMSSLFTTQIMTQMGLLPQGTPQQAAMMHDTAQQASTPQPQQASMEPQQQAQAQPTYVEQLRAQGVPDAQIMTAAMAKDPAKALSDAINTSRTVSGEKTFNEGRAGNEVERINVLQKNADVAANQNNALGAIEPVLEQAFTGKFAGTKADIINALGSVGVPLGPEVTNAAGATQAAQGFINRLVQEMAGGNLSKGITDQDRIFFEKQAVNPNMTPAGNKILIKGIKSINQRNIELNQMAIAEMHKNKGHLPDDWNDKVQQYAKDHPIFSPEDRTMGLSQGWNKTQGGVSWRPVQ